MNSYDEIFFDYVSAGAIRSARHFIPLILNTLNPNSVLDVGCGHGAWLSVWQEVGVRKVFGIDGDYVNKANLLCSQDCFLPCDLSKDFDLKQRFDLVQSLEVAEHLTKSSAYSFVSSLVKHGDQVLFSAAPKGQGGHHHINEQNYEYWRRIFNDHDFLPVDCFRPIIKTNYKIESWYRYNSILYVSRNIFNKLSSRAQESLVSDGKLIEDISPLPYKLRKLALGHVPVSIMTRLARIKEFGSVIKMRIESHQ